MTTAAMTMPMNMPMMGGMMPMTMIGGGMMPMMMCKMTCTMTSTGMKCEMMPMDDASKDMFIECCRRMMAMMNMGMQ